MPHLTVHALEDDLDGNETLLIGCLTDAVAVAYGGEWAREAAVVQLIGLPHRRWGVGGRPVTSVAPIVTHHVREAAFSRPDAEKIVSRLIAELTDAIVVVFGEEMRAGVTIRLVGTPAGRTGVGGVVAS